MVLCLNCNKETTNPKFCSSSCNASYNNKENHWRKKHGVLKGTSLCPMCGTKTTGKYCSHKCQRDSEYSKSIENWEQKAPGKNAIKRYLKETYGDKCSSCGIDSWQGNPIVLELEHKDGNSENNNKDNVCLLCPNCHSQTLTFKNRNKGNGRHARRVRYQEGKSF